jgi:gas vesicle protein
MGAGKIIIGVVAGAAAGALLGVLFAPDKGSETRQKISRKAQDYADAVKEKFSDLVDNFTSQFESAAEEAENFAGKAKNTAEEAKMPG